MNIKPSARISIKTIPNPMPPGQVPYGRDVFVEVVLPDGTRHPLKTVLEATINIVRHKPVSLSLVVADPELDVEADINLGVKA